MDNKRDDIQFTKIDILFAPHHGRNSGKIQSDILEELDPNLIIREANPENLNYYNGYNKITQNSAGNIIFECIENKVHIYVGNSTYSVDFLDDEIQSTYENYLGSFEVR